MWLSRIRTSAHHLAIEQGRYQNIPPDKRFCVYCSGGQHEPLGRGGDGGRDQVQGEIDDEMHFLLSCNRFTTSRLCFFKRIEKFVPNILKLSKIDILKTLLCPTTPQAGKVTNKFIGIMFRARSDIDSGQSYRNYPTWEPNMTNPFIIVRDIFSVSSGDEDLTDPDNTFLSESVSSIEEG